jgi:hypothetical protein
MVVATLNGIVIIARLAVSPSPNLHRRAAGEFHDELVVRNFGARADVGGGFRQPCLCDGRAVRVIILLGVVINDLYVHTPIDRALERTQNREIGELIGADAQPLTPLGIIDVFQAGFREPARQPCGFRIEQLAVVADVLSHLIRQRLVVERRLEGVAGDRATIEKDAVALIEFRLGLDRERERVPFFERVDVAVKRNDREVVAGARVRVIVGPQECLERLVARREVLLGIVVRDQVLEEFDAAQKGLRLSAHTALDGKTAQALARVRVHVHRHQHDMRACNRPHPKPGIAL